MLVFVTGLNPRKATGDGAPGDDADGDGGDVAANGGECDEAASGEGDEAASGGEVGTGGEAASGAEVGIVAFPLVAVPFGTGKLAPVRAQVNACASLLQSGGL